MKIWTRWNFLPALLFCLLLSGCGSYYSISVDSLRDSQLAAGVHSCYLEPGNPGVTANDLLFREVAYMLKPAFSIQGLSVVSRPEEAMSIARITYWEEEPQVTVYEGTTQRTQPVILWDGKKEKVEYVTVEEPTLSTQTVYGAALRIEARRQDGRQIWCTTVRCYGYNNDFRLLLSKTVPVLERTLGAHTNGIKDYEVSEDSNGQLVVKEVRSDDWW